jgi:ADP-heptose:LPS heptosyltransferase
MKSESSVLVIVLKKHLGVLRYLVAEILPVIVRTGHRPVIFSRFTGMGDIICTIPAALELKKRHPGKTFIYNCHPDFTDVPRLGRVTERVTSFEHIETLAYWYPRILGGFYHFAHRDDSQENVALEPMTVEFCRQFNLPVTEEHPQLVVDAKILERAKEKLANQGISLQKIILIHPGPSWKVKEWPNQKWTQLVAQLKERGYENIAQLGVGRYMDVGIVEVPIIPGAISLIDLLSIEECVAVISLARLFIGIDSGLLHIAASNRTPAVAIWGPTKPNLMYAKSFTIGFEISDMECSGCHHRLPRMHWKSGCPFNIQCMKNIEVNEVAYKCLKQIEGVKSQRIE